MKVFLTSNSVDEEILSIEKYKLFKDLLGIQGVEVSHFPSTPAPGEKGAVEILGFILKAITPGAVSQVIEVFAERATRMPEIRIKIEEFELETNGISVSEFKKLLENIEKRKNRLII